MENPKSILVTGASGFIGSVLVMRIIETGQNVRALVRNPDPATTLRRRVQSFIAQRFFRAKYDTDQVLSSFAATARGEVTLKLLSGALMNAIEETLQAERISLWLHVGQEK